MTLLRAQANAAPPYRWPEWPLVPRCPRCGARGSDPRAECATARDGGPDDCEVYRETAAELGYHAPD